MLERWMVPLVQTRTLTLTGLSTEEADARLREFGYNELPSAKPRSVVRIALNVLREPMLLLLVGAAAVYFVLGSPGDASILGAFVFVVIGITLYQERKTERALHALRDLSSPRALVIRNGERVRIPGREVAPGDLLFLAEGDRVPADGFLLSAVNLRIDESLLTGESVPVRKIAGETPDAAPAAPGGDDLPYVYSGTLVIRGQGLARAEATGIRTELGKIGKSLQTPDAEPTFLQKDARLLIRWSAIGAAVVCVVIAVGYGMTRGDWLRGFLAALTSAMALLPEELPVVLTVFLALGAWRISRLGVLTRHMPAIEALGAATVLCVDKTGTLTMNQMAVEELHRDGETIDAANGPWPKPFQDLLEAAVLASRPESFDPMDIGIRRCGETLGHTGGLHPGWTLVREYPLSSELLAVTDVWSTESGLMAACKGAPEAIADLCHLPDGERGEMLEAVSAMAGRGLRVLGAATARWSGAELPAHPAGFAFRFAGLIGLADPVRASAKDAVEECKEAGIRVVMITGDYAGTAVNVARQAGMGSEVNVITGAELAELSAEELSERVGRTAVFARAVPEQKLRLVQALKLRSEVVAMTGDGVNDAPALKAAHIGIAMGQRGTDVAREAADLVLLNDDFSSIVQAIRMGRRIFDNLKKAIAYTFAVHVPIAGLSLIPVLVGWPLILAPVHVAFLELIIDPACSIVFEAEPEETGIMKRPPRSIQERVFDRRTVLLALIQGTGVLLILLAVFAIALNWGDGEADARTLAFTTLVVANLALIQTNRSWVRGFAATARSTNTAMFWVSSGAGVFLLSALYMPFLRSLFGFTILHPLDIGLCLAAGLGSVGWFEILKWVGRRNGGARKAATPQLMAR